MTEEETRDILTDALSSTPGLSQHLDEDTTEYILSILLENPSDEDAREAVSGFIQSSIEDNGLEVSSNFFDILDETLGSGSINNGVSNMNLTNSQVDQPLRKLDNTITLKVHDIQTFASGLVAESDPTMIGDENEPSDIQSFYANMIDVSNVQAQSERERRKARQKEMRERMEEEERKRAIEDSMRMMEDGDGAMKDGNGNDVNREDMADVQTASDNAADVHFTNFGLANRKGGGPDLLTESNLTLSSGRRYGLMVRVLCIVVVVCWCV